MTVKLNLTNEEAIFIISALAAGSKAFADVYLEELKCMQRLINVISSSMTYKSFDEKRIVDRALKIVFEEIENHEK